MTPCPRCQGRMFVEADPIYTREDELVCLNCGYRERPLASASNVTPLPPQWLRSGSRGPHYHGTKL